MFGNRRTLLELAAVTVLPMRPQAPPASASADQPLGVIARHPLGGALEGFEIVLSRSAMRYFPGTSTPVHRHPGIVLAYVLEGRVRFAIDNGPEQVIPSGQTFF